MAELTVNGELLPVEYVPAASIRPHPDNYRSHPPDQIAHIIESIRENRLYRAVVVSADDFALAGHGLMIALAECGVDPIPVVREHFDHQDPRALKLLAGDNETANLADDSDAKLVSLLLRVHESSDDEVDALLGTGYNEGQLHALQALTAPPRSKDAWDPDREWEESGNDPYNSGEVPDWRLTIRFPTAEARDAYLGALTDVGALFRKSERAWLVNHTPEAATE